MLIAVLRLSGDESLVFWGPISWSSFWALIWCKWLKRFRNGILNFGINRLYLNSWTHFGKFKVAIYNFFVEFVTFLAHSSDCDSHNISWREKALWAHWIWWRHWLEWEKEDTWKLERKPLRNNFGMKATANEMDVATIRTAKRNARSLLIGGKGTR